MAASRIVVRPVTAERWDDLAQLFGPSGACAGCWCMYFRLPRAEFDRRLGPSNRRALQRIVKAGRIPGLIAYLGGVPAGWVALAPRDEFPLLGRSRLLKPVDDVPVWSVVCFYIARAYRGRGLMDALLRAAAAHARRRGARWLEGYPIDLKQDRLAAADVYHGAASAFRRVGFREAARRSPTRPIMRLRLR